MSLEFEGLYLDPSRGVVPPFDTYKGGEGDQTVLETFGVHEKVIDAAIPPAPPIRPNPESGTKWGLVLLLAVAAWFYFKRK